MATWDNNLGMWKASTGGYYNSQDEATAAEGSGAAPTKSVDLTDFQNNQGQASVAKPVDPNDTPNPNNPGGLSNNDLWNATDYNRRSATAVARTNAGTAGGLGTREGDPGAAPMLTTGIIPGSNFSNSHGQQYVVQRQTPEQLAAYNSKLGTVTDQGMVAGRQNLSIDPASIGVAPGGTGAAGAPGGTPSAATAAADQATQRAHNAFDDQVDTASATDTKAWSKAYDAINGLAPTDTTLSDEARSYQKEGLQQQRALLEKMLGYDPNQAATQFGDQALARSVALARSGGTAAQQQANTLDALDQAPGLYAEGQRQADAIQTQRLQGAENASQAFGVLGTGIRGQDTNQAQFESTLGLSIANSIGDLTKSQVTLNQQQTQTFAQIWTDFAKLQSVYAGMDETAQLHYLDQQFADKQLGQQWQMFKDTLAAQGEIKPKDIISGFFQLGGGAISAGGQILAANAKAGG